MGDILKKCISDNRHFNQLKLREDLNLPSYTLFEEILNSITHGLGIVFSIIAIYLLIISSSKSPKELFCVIVYGIILFTLYLVSTLYHALKICKAKTIFRILDHCSIFLTIAGTYTPICILKMGIIGQIVLGIIWIIAIIGIVLNSIDLNKYSKLSLACYIIMGWAIIFAIKPLINSVTSYQFWLLIGGGITYSVGAVLYALGKKFRYIHSLWHIFVLTGSILHFIMIYDFLRKIS